MWLRPRKRRRQFQKCVVRVVGSSPGMAREDSVSVAGAAGSGRRKMSGNEDESVVGSALSSIRSTRSGNIEGSVA
eukprot:8165475-Lingulodinium_polyedra.AAC.1